MAIIAPFWATTDTYFAFRDGHSKVYYQVYSQTNGGSSEILNMASQDVKLYGGDKKFANFAASWVLVVTWKKLCPYAYDNNCRWVIHLLSTLLLLLPMLLLWRKRSVKRHVPGFTNIYFSSSFCLSVISIVCGNSESVGLLHTLIG